MSTDAETCDVAIVGGGIVGAALACALATGKHTRGMRVVVVEHKEPPALEQVTSLDQPDMRVYAINPRSSTFMERIGVWDTIQAARATPYDTMQVWDGLGPGTMRFDAAGAGLPALGHIIEHGVLQGALFARMRALEQEGLLSLRCPASLDGIDNADGSGDPWAWPTLRFTEGAPVSARLVAACDGGASRVRSLSGVGTVSVDYDQRGLVAAVRTSHPHATAWQRFLPTGPLALLPCHGSFSSIVWTLPHAEARRKAELSPEAFVAELNAALSGPPMRPAQPPVPPALAPLATLAQGAADAAAGLAAAVGGRAAVPPRVEELSGPRASFPLRAVHSNKYHVHRTAFVGDAAHVVHPLAGQGLNLGLGDAEALARVVGETVQNGGDAGFAPTLRQYGAERRRENVAMQGAIHAVRALFLADMGPVSWARNVGLSAIHAAGPVKALIAAIAAGHTQPPESLRNLLPRALRGDSGAP